MNSASIATLEVGGQALMLLPEKAVFLPDSDTLIVADVQLGKPSPFLQPAVAGTHNSAPDATLSELTRLIQKLSVRHLVFLGHFLRGDMEPSLSVELQRWRELHHLLELTVVNEPNDVAVNLTLDLAVQTRTEPLLCQGLVLRHQPELGDLGFVLAGSTYPCVNIGGIGGRTHDWLRLPCFWFAQRLGVLPTFGALSGMETIRAKRGDRVFAVAVDRVFELRPAIQN
jgi:uncharacterized protein